MGMGHEGSFLGAYMLVQHAHKMLINTPGCTCRAKNNGHFPCIFAKWPTISQSGWPLWPTIYILAPMIMPLFP